MSAQICQLLSTLSIADLKSVRRYLDHLIVDDHQLDQPLEASRDEPADEDNDQEAGEIDPAFTCLSREEKIKVMDAQLKSYMEGKGECCVM